MCPPFFVDDFVDGWLPNRELLSERPLGLPCSIALPNLKHLLGGQLGEGTPLAALGVFAVPPSAFPHHIVDIILSGAEK